MCEGQKIVHLPDGWSAHRKLIQSPGALKTPVYNHDARVLMARLIHHVEQHRFSVPGIEAMTLVSNPHFPRHSHDQLAIGVMAFGAHRSWSGVGEVEASAGDVIMANPGEMHEGMPLDGKVRGWRMVYFDPALGNPQS